MIQQFRSGLSAGFLLLATAAAAMGFGDPILPRDAGVPLIDWKEAHKYMDQEVSVQGRIVATHNTGTICFLNLDKARSFTAVVHGHNFKYFSTPPEAMYAQKLVRIRGVISAYQGKAQIEVIRPEQVTIIEEEQPITSSSSGKGRAFRGTVTVATFNVLNLFDEYDDPYHYDESTPAKPKEQLEKLAARIKELDADVLAMQEVENEGYLQRFVGAMLPGMGYEHVVCPEGNDQRGIDVALLSRLPVGPVTSYRHLRFPDASGGMMSYRRDLLQVRIEPPDCPPFDMFVVHFKSKRGGASETESERVGEAQQTRKLLSELLGRDKGARFLICGDFNDTFESRALKVLVGEGATALRAFIGDLPEKTASYNRGRSDDMIDYILASPAMAETYVPKSYKIVSGSVEAGGSDHNPVVSQFRLAASDTGAGAGRASMER